MMTTLDPTATRRRPSDRAPPGLTVASEIVAFGHLAWLAWTRLVITVVYAVIVGCVVRWGSVDDSLWHSVVAGWQRWVVFAAGVTTTTTFLRMLVRNGATRSLLSSASTVAMVVIGGLGALWITAGYADEKVLYDRYGWPQGLYSGTVFEWSDLWRVAIETPLVLFAYFVSGWLVGAGFYRYGVAGGLALLIPSLVPAATCELVTSREFGGIDMTPSRRRSIAAPRAHRRRRCGPRRHLGVGRPSHHHRHPPALTLPAFRAPSRRVPTVFMHAAGLAGLSA